MTDLYQLSMAAGYWRVGNHQQPAVFQLFFRKLPFAGGYAIAAGLEDALLYLEQLRFDSADCEYLASLRGNDEQPLFPKDFLGMLASFRFECDVRAIAEGTVVFPHEPILQVEGPLLQAQLVETALLNIINFQTLIATKAARVVQAAQGDPVLEFGLRRAQGVDGALSASRAAFIGGCAATSNVLAGKVHGIPVKGTHAHSWVMAYASELDAFRAYAKALPNNVALLVDTYDTLQGVRNAVTIGKELQARGARLAGIRLDSGDLAFLSIEARKILDAAGFTETAIVASNDLDEDLVESLKHQGARIGVWGVGTKLVTAYDQPALGGVYKLAAIQDSHGAWQPKVKLSEQAIKISNPGVLQVRRYRDSERFVADCIYDREFAPVPDPVLVDPADPLRQRKMEPGLDSEDLLTAVMKKGVRTGSSPALGALQAHAREQLKLLHPAIRRQKNPHGYPVGLEESLYRRKLELVQRGRRSSS